MPVNGPWQAIAETTNHINQEVHQMHERKIYKDGVAIASNSWAHFLQKNTDLQHQAHSLTDVGIDQKTGNLSAIMSIKDAAHPDYAMNGKTLRDYVNHHLTSHEKALLSPITNPVAKRLLEERTQAYRPQVLGQIAELEAKLIEGKRYSMAIDSLEKYEKAAYSNPHKVGDYAKDFADTTKALTLMPEEREKLDREAHKKLGTAAAMGVLHQSPEAFLSNPAWKDQLDTHTYIQLHDKATTLIRHQQHAQQSSLKNITQSHFDSLMATGQGIEGIENMVQNTYGKDSEVTKDFIHKHNLYQYAGTVKVQLKNISFEDGAKAIEAMVPQPGDLDFSMKQKVVKTLMDDLDTQKKQAKDDPAAYVEGIFGVDRPQDEALSFPEKLRLRKIWQEQKGIPAYAQKVLTKEDKKVFLKSFETSDPVQLEQAMQQLLALGDDSMGVGNVVLQELAQDQKSLPILTNLYVKSSLLKQDIKDSILKMIPIQKQLFSSQSTEEQKMMKKELESNSDLRKYYDNRIKGQPQNVPQVEMMKKGVRLLARFYQLERGLDMGDAVEQAVKDLIVDTTITPRNELTIPKKIIQDNKVVELDEDKMKGGLVQLRRHLIQELDSFDSIATFGWVPNNPILQGEAKSRQREILEDGQFRLSPDERFLYYAIAPKNGVERPLMASSTQVWSIPVGQVQDFDALLPFTGPDIWDSTEK